MPPASAERAPASAAAVEYATIDVARNPGSQPSASAAAQLGDACGNLVAVLENRASVALTRRRDRCGSFCSTATGSIVQQRSTVRPPGRALQPGERAGLDAGVGAVAQDVIGRVRLHRGRRPVQSPANVAAIGLRAGERRVARAVRWRLGSAGARCCCARTAGRRIHASPQSEHPGLKQVDATTWSSFSAGRASLEAMASRGNGRRRRLAIAR